MNGNENASPSNNFLMLLLLLQFLHRNVEAARGSQARGKSPKVALPFKNANEQSSSDISSEDPKNARITESSHFSQVFRLGYKILLICVAEGDPSPTIKWFKDGLELPIHKNTHVYEQRDINTNKIKSKVEIDPATVGDQGIYTCVANNQHAGRFRNFKAEYYY